MITIGIDLGTTFCCASFINTVNASKPELIPLEEDSVTLPSVVYFQSSKTVMVGKYAEDAKLGDNASSVFEFIKLDMGKPTEYVDNNFNVEIKPYEMHGIKYGATGMQAIILRKIFIKSRRYLLEKQLISPEERVLDCVITVPAAYGNLERSETILAGMIAGFNVKDIIDEPNAAAIRWGIDNQPDKTILVFDLGGGTFDVTIMKVATDQSLRIIAKRGLKLGGKNFDEVILQHFIHELAIKYDVSLDNDQKNYLRKKATEAKIKLSANESVQLSLDINNEIYTFELFRKQDNSKENLNIDINDDKFYFNEQCSGFLEQIGSLIKSTLQDCRFTWHDIDEIVLAGGSSRMPMIREYLSDISGKEIVLNESRNSPDTAISIGAALYGNTKLRVSDVLSHGLGYKVRDKRRGRDMISPFFNGNTEIPCSKTFSESAEANAFLEIHEIRDPEFKGTGLVEEIHCRKIAEVLLDNQPGIISLFFEVNAQGILSIRTGSTDLSVTVNRMNSINPDRLRDMENQIRSLTIR